MSIEQSPDLTATTFEQYAGLTLEQRALLIDRVYEAHAETIEERLGSKATWLLVCGPDLTIIEEVERPEDIPTDDQVWEKGSELGYAPFQFFATETIDDLAAA